MEFKCPKWFTEQGMGTENEWQNLSRFIFIFITIFYFYSLNITFINIKPLKESYACLKDSFSMCAFGISIFTFNTVC